MIRVLRVTPVQCCTPELWETLRNIDCVIIAWSPLPESLEALWITWAKDALGITMPVMNERNFHVCVESLARISGFHLVATSPEVWGLRPHAETVADYEGEAISLEDTPAACERVQSWLFRDHRPPRPSRRTRARKVKSRHASE